MTTTLRFLGLNNHSIWRSEVNHQLNHLQHLTTMTAAEVVLVHQRKVTPPFRVEVRLELPGPDLHAEATDYTLESALLKATQELEYFIQIRKPSRMERHNCRPQRTARSSRFPHVRARQMA